MSYNWIGMKELSWDEVKMLYKNHELKGAYLLYPDGTESQITSDCHYMELVRHYDNGGGFGIEIPRKEIAFSDGFSATAPELIDWAKCVSGNNIEKWDEIHKDIWNLLQKYMAWLNILPKKPNAVSEEAIHSVHNSMIELFCDAGCTIDITNYEK